MPRVLLILSAALAVLSLASCDTFERRSRQKAAVFSALDPLTQAKLERGVIEIGHTPDMVFIALGAPDDEFETTTNRGQEKTWVFNSYHQEFAGNVRTGYQRVLVHNQATNNYTVYYEPVYSDVYVQREEERIRITFRDGKVAVIEQPKRPQ